MPGSSRQARVVSQVKRPPAALETPRGARPTEVRLHGWKQRNAACSRRLCGHAHTEREVRIAVQAGEAPDVLVLARKVNQSIMIGDHIEVSVLAIMGETVRIGIDAPHSVPVFRKEVYVEIQQDLEIQQDRDG